MTYQRDRSSWRRAASTAAASPPIARAPCARWSSGCRCVPVPGGLGDWFGRSFLGRRAPRSTRPACAPTRRCSRSTNPAAWCWTMSVSPAGCWQATIRWPRARPRACGWPPPTGPHPWPWRALMMTTSIHSRFARRHPAHGRPVRQVQHLHQRLPGRPGHRPVPRPEVCRPAGAALPRPRLALARPFARLLLGLRRLHAGLPARRQGHGDQHRGQGRAAQAAIPREPARSASGGATRYSVTTRSWARSAARCAARQRGHGLRAGADPHGKDLRHRSPRARSRLSTSEIPRLVLRPAPACEGAGAARRAEGGLLPRLRDPALRARRSARPSSPSWSTTASR